MSRTVNCPGQRSEGHEVAGGLSWIVKCCRQYNGVGSGLSCRGCRGQWNVASLME